ncbi:hypothetical protein KA078_03175 [Candidatus Woesebacteria bacterium]|nr:hypothetical protein [Candidatus Woesebacteria bacterium]
MSEPTAQVPFSALTRLKEALSAANMPEDDVAFILGRLTRSITETVVNEVSQVIDVPQLQELSKIENEEERMNKMGQFFQQKTGKSISALREEVTEKLVAEFESIE